MILNVEADWLNLINLLDVRRERGGNRRERRSYQFINGNKKGGTRLRAAVSSIQLSCQKLQPPRPFLFNPMLQISVDLGLGGARADWLCTASSLQGGGGVGCCVRSVQQLTETGRERQL